MPRSTIPCGARGHHLGNDGDPARVARIGRKGETSFVRDTVTRFMGLIVVATGAQFILTGIKSFMTIAR